MRTCFFVSDLHGKPERYLRLFAAIAAERPRAVFFGGDLLPHEMARVEGLPRGGAGFLDGFLAKGMQRLRAQLQHDYPACFLILGNDDARSHEAAVLRYSAEGLWTYVHRRRVPFGEWEVCGYACIPPSPFQLKDFERYDVSRFVDPGCVPPTEGFVTVPVSERELHWKTIEDDLKSFESRGSLDRCICLFHAPPYQTRLDRAGLDGKSVDHAPVDVHIGSVAIRRFLERTRPAMGLHGHVHESARLTGDWRDEVGSVPVMSAAHDGPELALIRFDPDRPREATRELLPVSSSRRPGAGGSRGR